MNSPEGDKMNAEEWFNQGVALGKEDKWEDALKAFEKAIEIDSRYAWAWNNKGVALDRLGRYNEALKAFEKVIEIDPQDAKTWFNKGAILWRLGEHGDALKALQKTIEIDPQDARAWNNTGVTLARLGRHREALKALGRAIDANPDYAWSYGSWGEILLDMGCVEGAAEKVKEALDREPELAWVLILDGRIKLEKKYYDDAIQSFKKAICSDLSNPLPLLWDAYAEYLKIEPLPDQASKECQEELTIIIRKLERANDWAQKRKDQRVRAYVLYYLGYFHCRKKDFYGAKEKLEEYLKSEPEAAIKSAATTLLNHIWNYNIKPPLWRWWLSSPVHGWWKRVVFFFLTVSILALLFLHPFVPGWLSYVNMQVNWTLYIILVGLSIVLLALPTLESVKAKEIEVKLASPPSFEPVLSPLTMEMGLRELEEA